MMTLTSRDDSIGERTVECIRTGVWENQPSSGPSKLIVTTKNTYSRQRLYIRFVYHLQRSIFDKNPKVKHTRSEQDVTLFPQYGCIGGQTADFGAAAARKPSILGSTGISVQL